MIINGLLFISNMQHVYKINLFVIDFHFVIGLRLDGSTENWFRCFKFASRSWFDEIVIVIDNLGNDCISHNVIIEIVINLLLFFTYYLLLLKFIIHLLFFMEVLV